MRRPKGGQRRVTAPHNLRRLSCAFAHAVRPRRLTAWAKSREANALHHQLQQAPLPTLRIRVPTENNPPHGNKDPPGPVLGRWVTSGRRPLPLSLSASLRPAPALHAGLFHSPVVSGPGANADQEAPWTGVTAKHGLLMW